MKKRVFTPRGGGGGGAVRILPACGLDFLMSTRNAAKITKRVKI